MEVERARAAGGERLGTRGAGTSRQATPPSSFARALPLALWLLSAPRTPKTHTAASSCAQVSTLLVCGAGERASGAQVRANARLPFLEELSRSLAPRTHLSSSLSLSIAAAHLTRARAPNSRVVWGHALTLKREGGVGFALSLLQTEEARGIGRRRRLEEARGRSGGAQGRESARPLRSLSLLRPRFAVFPFPPFSPPLLKNHSLPITPLLL
jgi:hypothetical protein